MSSALVRKSLEICDSNTDSLQKKGDKNLRKLQKISKRKRSSANVRSVAEAVKRMKSEKDKTEENIKKLELLSSFTIEEDIVQKIITRAGKCKPEEVKVESKNTVFTEQDFASFEKEYFGV